MAFWYKNFDGLGISPDNSEAEIIEDWELEDVTPGTYETVSELVTARWDDYRRILAKAIESGAVSAEMNRGMLSGRASARLDDMVLEHIDCACVDGSDTDFYLDVIVIAEILKSEPDYAAVEKEFKQVTVISSSQSEYYGYLCSCFRKTVKRKQWFRIRTCENAQHFQENDGSWYFCSDPEISVYRRKDNLRGIKLTDCLVGVISLEQIEEDTERRLIRHGMTASIAKKGFVDMWEYADKLGADIRYAKLSVNRRIASKLCLPGKTSRVYEYYGENRPVPCMISGQLMLDGLDTVYETAITKNNLSLQTLSKYHKVSLKFQKPTILIDPFVCDTESKEQNGISHECFHIEVHPRFLFLQNHQRTRFTALNMTEEDYDTYEEERERYAELTAADSQSDSADWDEIDWVEWQARMGSVCKRLPRSIVRQKMQELYTHFISTNSKLSESEITEHIINELALTFHVSKEMARIRMIEVGFEPARGTMVFVDGRYAPSHRTSTGIHPRNISYVISMFDAARLYAEDERFYNTLQTGRFLFVDNFFCLNSPKWLTKRDGAVHLNEDALNHIDKCCLSFHIEYKSRTSYFDKTGLHSDSVTADPIANALASIPFDVFMGTLENSERKFDDLPDTYGETIVYHRERLGMTQEELAWQLGIKRTTLREYEQNKIFEPSRIFFISIGIILKLPGYFTKDMMSKAGCPLVPANEAFQRMDFIVTFMYMRPFEECQAAMKRFNLPSLLGRSLEECEQHRQLRQGKLIGKDAYRPALS